MQTTASKAELPVARASLKVQSPMGGVLERPTHESVWCGIDGSRPRTLTWCGLSACLLADPGCTNEAGSSTAVGMQSSTMRLVSHAGAVPGTLHSSPSVCRSPLLPQIFHATQLPPRLDWAIQLRCCYLRHAGTQFRPHPPTDCATLPPSLCTMQRITCSQGRRAQSHRPGWTRADWFGDLKKRNTVDSPT